MDAQCLLSNGLRSFLSNGLRKFHAHFIILWQIMNQLWEINAGIISNVVAAQIRLLRRKLDLDDSGLIETIYGIGYRLNTPVREA